MPPPAEPAYCAPADRPLIMLHIAEPGADLAAPPGCEPLTVCGLPMTPAELWMAADRRPGDAICPVCEAGEQLFECPQLWEGVA